MFYSIGPRSRTKWHCFDNTHSLANENVNRLKGERFGFELRLGIILNHFFIFVTSLRIKAKTFDGFVNIAPSFIASAPKPFPPFLTTHWKMMPMTVCPTYHIERFQFDRMNFRISAFRDLRRFFSWNFYFVPKCKFSQLISASFKEGKNPSHSSWFHFRRIHIFSPDNLKISQHRHLRSWQLPTLITYTATVREYLLLNHFETIFNAIDVIFLLSSYAASTLDCHE
jgi:hypothetical protein